MFTLNVSTSRPFFSNRRRKRSLFFSHSLLDTNNKKIHPAWSRRPKPTSKGAGSASRRRRPPRSRTPKRPQRRAHRKVGACSSRRPTTRRRRPRPRRRTPSPPRGAPSGMLSLLPRGLSTTLRSRRRDGSVDARAAEKEGLFFLKFKGKSAATEGEQREFHLFPFPQQQVQSRTLLFLAS